MKARKEPVAQLVQQLRAASAAYYNGGPALMDDDTYDAAVERLRELDPKNSFLEEVGAPVPGGAGATRLAHPMPSLDKIKPGEDRLHRFLAAAPPGGLVLSEKLDGLSALWIPGNVRDCLYLRGDGLIGQNISPFATKGIKGLVVTPSKDVVAVRGELILPRSEGESQPRAWVNGILHRKEDAVVLEDVAKIRFVAYELFSLTPMRRSYQFEWLRSAGFEVPWWMHATTLKEQDLAAALQSRRAESPYDTDGIVVGYNQPPQSECTVDRCRNPKDAVAFKMPLADQAAETTVRAVHWGTSNQGYLIPKLEFDPVTIGSATIQFCTAHNAKTVAEKGLGPGAQIVIRRSGDVIPKLDAVLKAAGLPSFPPEGSYEWDATRTHIRMAASSAPSKEVQVARLGHFLKTLDIPGAGPATAIALVEAGVTGPQALWSSSSEQLSKVLGPKTGEALWSNLRKALDAADEKLLMIASSQMPRGIGETKLKALLELHPDPSRWKEVAGAVAVAAPKGWTAQSLTTFLTEYAASYELWRHSELSWIPYPKRAAATSTTKAASTAPKQVLCFTGFRDKALEQAAQARGHIVSPSLTGKVTILLVPDGTSGQAPSEKVKAAQAKGIRILSRSEFQAQYLDV
jgi:DNA ligase (NAD+)